jgi:hypothetical protein
MFLPNDYYCAIFHLASGLQRANMMSDTDTASVVIILALYLKWEKKNRMWIKKWYKQSPYFTHEISWQTNFE